ncbi:FMN-binding protein [Lacisediminihabitans changchengi]|uniref:FMN-binding protein n=1 Tax=Lacisediminihabitans changchengi TaxID=2787634 RepID=A0A934SIT3_9MICO|nr:FMN-binding protein [Lacisediminihabitans changchengi]MBK4346045.1 FMN-binding protein [Lacisediminihabitans changchengi]
MRTPNKYALSAFAGVSLVGTLAGCSATASAGTSNTSSDTSASASPSTGDSTGTYKDGSYTEDGEYNSPGGEEKVEVKVTLADGVITAVTVASDASNDPTGKQYQAQFIKGISAQVVGKKIDSLSVSKVSGSSLTSMGFNAAITKIKADASA